MNESIFQIHYTFRVSFGKYWVPTICRILVVGARIDDEGHKNDIIADLNESYSDWGSNLGKCLLTG